MPDVAVRRLDQIELLKQLITDAACFLPRQPLQSSEQAEILATGQQTIDRGVLTSHADELAHRVGLAPDVIAEDARGAAFDGQQGGEHLQHGGLARAVGPQHPEDLTLVDDEVDAVDSTVGAEGLDQTLSLDGKGVVGRRPFESVRRLAGAV